MNATITKIGDIIDTADACKHAYFWSPGGNAGARRANERKHDKPEVAWSEGGHNYTARFDYSESCHRVYAKGVYTKDGQRTTLTAIRNSYSRLKEATK